MHGTTVELTHEEYRTAWQTLGLGTRHWNMDLPGLPVLTEQERRAQMAQALEGLHSRGLADHRGFDPALESALRLLATPVHEINGWMRSMAAGQVRLLAGSRGDRAALATLDDRRLLVHTSSAGELCTAVTRQLPDRPAGPGSSISVPSALLAQPTHDGKPGLTGEQLRDRLVRGGVKPADADSFTAMVRGLKPGGAKFGAARRDRNNARRPAGKVLVYLATERGGYTMQPVSGPDGADWTTLAPATLAQLAHRIGQLLGTIRTS